MSVKREPETIQSVKRAFELLEFISQEKEIGIRDLSRRAGFSKATVQRLISTLLEAGYVTCNLTTHKYHLSFKLFQLGNCAIYQNDLRTVARPIIEEMQENVKENVVLGILDGGDVIYIDKLTVPQEIQLASSVGSRVPVHCTATGKAILAFLPDEESTKVLQTKELKRYTQNTITGIEKLKQELAEIRARGFAVDIEERFPGVTSIAAPIMNYSGQVAGAVGIPGFIYRIQPERIPSLGRIVMRAAAEISSRLGYKI